MKYSFELKTDVASGKIWSLYEDVNKWFSWEGNLEDISLRGPFSKNTTGTMKLFGQPSMEFMLDSVINGKIFTNKTSIPNIGDIYFIHELIVKDNQTIIKHSVEFLPKNREPKVNDLEFVSKIFADVPATVFSLVRLANE